MGSKNFFALAAALTMILASEVRAEIAESPVGDRGPDSYNLLKRDLTTIFHLPKQNHNAEISALNMSLGIETTLPNFDIDSEGIHKAKPIAFRRHKREVFFIKPGLCYRWAEVKSFVYGSFDGVNYSGLSLMTEFFSHAALAEFRIGIHF